MVQAVTTRDFRKAFKQYANDASDYNDTIIITRPKQKNVVLISQEEYNSWQETNYLLASKANQQALAESLAQLNDSGADNQFLTPEEFEKMTNND